MGLTEFDRNFHRIFSDLYLYENCTRKIFYAQENFKNHLLSIKKTQLKNPLNFRSQSELLIIKRVSQQTYLILLRKFMSLFLTNQ